MFKLLRQQFEMKMGSLTKGEVDRGQKSNDEVKGEKGKTQPFKLSDITGEIDPEQFDAMLELGIVPDTGGVNKKESAEWKDDGSGLAFKPTSRQVHTVVAKDTFGTLAQKYLGDESKWEQIRKENQVVLNPATKKPEDLRKQGKDKALPVGLTLNVPGNMSLLDQLAPYVEAWDEEEDETKDKLGKAKPKWDGKKAKSYTKLQEKQKGDPTKISEDVLTQGFAALRSPKDKDPGYIPVPGLGQDHKVDKPLGSDEDQDEADALHGQLNPRQYAHLRMLARADEVE
jgi:hypothetical protein